MHALIKFTQKEFAESFQSGILYMNSLNYFQNNGFEDQKDNLEGVILSANPHSSSDLPSSLIDCMPVDILYQAVGFSFCHVFCMSCIEIVTLQESPHGMLVDIRTPADMEKFGEYAVIIDDETEFLRRINQALKDYKYLCGRVNYHPPSLGGHNVNIGHHIVFKREDTVNITGIVGKVKSYDAFDKFDKYRNQKEWRICLYDCNANTGYVEINIGDIHDISHVIKTSDMEKEIYQFKYNQNFLNSHESYFGNASRRELRNLFYQLGNCQAWQLITIG